MLTEDGGHRCRFQGDCRASGERGNGGVPTSVSPLGQIPEIGVGVVEEGLKPCCFCPFNGGAKALDLEASLVAVGIQGIGKGPFTSVVPPGQPSRGGGGLQGEDVVGRGGEVLEELVGGRMKGFGV